MVCPSIATPPIREAGLEPSVWPPSVLRSSLHVSTDCTPRTGALVERLPFDVTSSIGGLVAKLTYALSFAPGASSSRQRLRRSATRTKIDKILGWGGGSCRPSNVMVHGQKGTRNKNSSRGSVF